MSSASILIIDDDPAHAQTLGDALSAEGYAAEVITTGEAGLEAVRRGDYDIVLTDLRMAEVDGMQILEAARARGDVEVLMITGHGSVESAVEAMRKGAAHYITKPVNIIELRELLRRIADKQRLSRRNTELEAELESRYSFDAIIGRSEPMQQVFQVMRQVARTDVTVLITGESGTGKELVARAIHRHSKRGRGPFVALNCAALPENLLESELFGYERGAFTGANSRKIGHIESADGGTLLLDEVGDMPLATQAKLLRVLEQREIVRLGSSKPVSVDVRVLAATNKNLTEEVADRRFREDLYFRLKVVSIELPPLRKRAVDIPFLVDSFVKELAATHGTGTIGLSREVLRVLEIQPWPGNVRELRNVIENMVVTGAHEILQLSDLPPAMQTEELVLAGTPTSHGGLAGRTAADVEREHISATLDLVGGNRARAARMMGIGERTLYRKIKEYALT